MTFDERRNREEEELLRREAERAGVSLPRRRLFMDVLLGTSIAASLAAFFYPVIRYLVPPRAANLGTNQVVAARVGELKANSGKIFRFGTRPALLILTAEGRYVAMSAVCTHLGCTVQYRPDLDLVWCPCHNGRYNLRGDVVSGPPPRPLRLYEVDVRAEQVFVSRS